MQPSSLRQIDLATLVKLGVLSGMVIASSTILFLNSLNFPACSVCDAVGYGVDAARIQQNGLAVPMASRGLRTYAYPVFLSVVFAGYQWDATWGIFSPRAAIVQTGLYLAACLALFFALLPRNRTFAWCAAIGLMCNPFVLNYVPLRMTESITASIAVLLAACAVSLVGAPRRLLLVLFVGSLLAGLAMMIRPANLSIFVAWCVMSVFVGWRNPGRRLSLAIVATSGLLIPLLPQVAINYFVYGKIGFLPTSGLGEFQTRLGLRYLKYMTVVRPDRSAIPVFYPNPMFSGAETDQAGVWLYLLSPLRGAVTAAGHVFQSVNHDFFFTYNYRNSPWANAPINFLGHVSLFLGGVAVWGFAASSSLRTYRWLPAVVFTAITVIMTLMVNSVAIVETRFGMLVYVAAGPLAVWGAIQLRSSQRRGMTAAATLLYATGATALSFAMLPS